MKNLVWLSAVALLGYITLNVFPPERFELSYDDIKEGKASSVFLSDMIKNGNGWTLTDEKGALVTMLPSSTEVLSCKQEWANSSVNQHLILKVSSDQQYELTGMCFDGKMNATGNILLWVRTLEVPSKNYKIRGNYNFNPSSFQNAVDLANNYAVLLP